MENPEIITDKKIIELLECLKNDRTILKLNIPDAGDELLSIVIDIKAEEIPPHFAIDFPGGATEHIKEARGKKIIIGFKDKDRIQYVMKSFIERVSEHNLYILLPESIQKLQRRKYFRVSSPIGTKVIIDEPNINCEFNVINISEGGALITHPDKIGLLKGDQKPLSILFNEADNVQRISIDKAEIKRIEKETEKRCCNYAFQFLDRGKKEENYLRNFIYSCQRKMLLKKKFSEEDGN
jgi:c-di-GMP-binding flagellar brake protein YcgR